MTMSRLRPRFEPFQGQDDLGVAILPNGVSDVESVAAADRPRDEQILLMVVRAAALPVLAAALVVWAAAMLVCLIAYIPSRFLRTR